METVRNYYQNARGHGFEAAGIIGEFFFTSCGAHLLSRANVHTERNPRVYL